MVVECNNSWVPYKQVNDLVDSYYHKYVIVHKHVGQCNIDNSLWMLCHPLGKYNMAEQMYMNIS